MRNSRMKSLPAPHFIVALCLAGSLAGCAHVPGGSAQSEFAGKEEAPTSIQEILDTGPVTGGRESSDGWSSMGSDSRIRVLTTRS